MLLTLSACSSGGGPGGSGGEISYWLWDSNQVPAYQACAAAFTEANPDTTVKIEQYAWADYWTKLTASFVGGSGPDVFVDHLSKYGEFAEQGRSSPTTISSSATASTRASTPRGCWTRGSTSTAPRTASPRTGTPPPTSTTSSSSPTRATPRRTCGPPTGTPTTVARSRRSSRT
ncbi:extracellular solute-binding protein [Oerskovia sp. M15]